MILVNSITLRNSITLFNRALASVALILCIILSSGCQFVPASEQVSGTEQTTRAAVDGAEPQESIKQPNPYLSERASAPAVAKKRFQAAKQAIAEKNWSQAQADLQWIIKNYPKLSGPYLNLALIYREQQQPENAEQAFKQAINANGNNVNAYNQYGIFLREQGRFSDAQAIYLQGLAVWPDHPDCNKNLGILYDLYMGKLDQALPYYKHYQSLLDKPDRVIAGWIADTERRLAQLNKTP